MPKKSIIAILLALFTPIPAYAQDVASELIDAEQNGQAEKVQALLEAGADVHAKGENGMMALMWAAFGGDAETVQVLLDGGADVSLEDKQGTKSQMWTSGSETRRLWSSFSLSKFYLGNFSSLRRRLEVVVVSFKPRPFGDQVIGEQADVGVVVPKGLVVASSLDRDAILAAPFSALGFWCFFRELLFIVSSSPARQDRLLSGFPPLFQSSNRYEAGHKPIKDPSFGRTLEDWLGFNNTSLKKCRKFPVRQRPEISTGACHRAALGTEVLRLFGQLLLAARNGHTEFVELLRNDGAKE